MLNLGWYYSKSHQHYTNPRMSLCSSKRKKKVFIASSKIWPAESLCSGFELMLAQLTLDYCAPEMRTSSVPQHWELWFWSVHGHTAASLSHHLLLWLKYSLPKNVFLTHASSCRCHPQMQRGPLSVSQPRGPSGQCSLRLLLKQWADNHVAWAQALKHKPKKYDFWTESGFPWLVLNFVL